MSKHATARKTSALLLCLLMLFGPVSSAAYAADAEDGAIVFTEAEQAVIRASQQNPITVGVLPSAAPECDYDAKTGRFTGINMEMLRTVSERTGLVLAYLPIDLSVKYPVDWLKAGDFDLVAGILRMPGFINDPELLLSDTIMPDCIVMVGRRGEDFSKNAAQRKIAVMDGFQAAKIYVNAHFPEHMLLPCSTIEECLHAVANGQADATVYSRVCISYILQNPRYQELQIVPAYSQDITICIAGLSKDKGPLMSVIDKGLRSITDADRNAIIMEYTILNPYPLSIWDKMYEYRVPVLIIGLLLVLIVAAMVFILSYRRKSMLELKAAYEQSKAALALAEKARGDAEKATRAALATSERLRRQISLTHKYQTASETDELTGLLNRRGGEQRIREMISHERTGLLCLFDIDKFKQINDRFGHKTGDEALIAVAQCMRAFRDNDVQLRYGGDEFLVYAVGVTTKEQACICVERFLSALRNITVPGMEGQTLSVSIGLLLCTQDAGKDYDALIKRADEAMYQCKSTEQERYRFG